MPRVSPQYAEGWACPHCGRPLFWIGRWMRDRNSPDGRSFKRESVTWYLDEPVARGDKPVTRVVSRQGYEGRTVTKYAHVSTMQCPRCCREYSSSQANHVPPPPPDKAPAGYYLPEG
ncbi:MAG: hypothetical protein IKE22_00115 [Atopobiaceae bacterium]|nr:hypothetical protein [Atopobiaceae bacterium]